MYLEKFDLSGRVAVVTGGGRGIGLACSQALAEAGARIVIADIDPEVGAAGQKALAETGPAAQAIQGAIGTFLTSVVAGAIIAIFKRRK